MKSTIALTEALFIVIAATLLGVDYGYRVGLAVALLGYALKPAYM
jgi:predicted anti-sigma-YlaC factor YlaD